MAGETEAPSTALPGGLDERVLSTLQGLNGSIAFSGLRRVLRAHPESLSRSLRRLEREGRIERSDDGYRALIAPSRANSSSSPGVRSIAHVDLPPGVSADLVFGRLTGRWFGSLRWVGVVDHPGGRLLAWAKRDGAGYVMLGIQRGVLRVYAREELAGDDPDEAEDSAYELLSHAIEAIRPTPRSSDPSVTLLAGSLSEPSLSFEN
jgi:hypothetical protein